MQIDISNHPKVPIGKHNALYIIKICHDSLQVIYCYSFHFSDSFRVKELFNKS